MKVNYVHKDSTTLVQDELFKNELNQLERQYNAIKEQIFNKLVEENQQLKEIIDKAICYVQENTCWELRTSKLLEILKGENNE